TPSWIVSRLAILVASARGYGHRLRREDLMLEATTICQAKGSVLSYLHELTQEQTSDSEAKSASLEERTLLQPPQIHRTAHVLVIGDGLRAAAIQLRRAFPVP